MRIIGGEFKGHRVTIPKNLPVRPTTDFAREGLFNILEHSIELSGVHVLDLFSGTGLVGLEFNSRGCASVTMVEGNAKCAKHLRKATRNFEGQFRVLQKDAFKWVVTTPDQFNIVFADPPYEDESVDRLPGLIFRNENLLPGNGLLIIEHSSKTDFSQQPNFADVRNYGNVNFSFFKKLAK